jgi:phosphatidylglycerol:prolipoprotein diacylglycerol transferase
VKPLLLDLTLPVIGRVTFPAYFTLLAFGFACAILLTWRDAKRLDINADRIIDLNLYMIIFGIIGSRLLHVIADGYFWDYVNICFAPETVKAVGNVPASCTADAQCGPYFLCNTAAGHCHPPRDCLLALKVWRGGLTYYGGFIGAVAFAVIYLRRHRLPFWRIFDMAGYAIPFGLFWGRMGCFLNGCCFGTVTRSALGVVFLRGGPAWRRQKELGLVDASAAAPLPVHPTQLYSALLNLGIYAACYFWIRPRKQFDGQVFWWFVILKAVTRGVVEIFRDDDRGAILWFSTSQFISLLLLVVAAVALRTLRRHAQAVPPQAAGS